MHLIIQLAICCLLKPQCTQVNVDCCEAIFMEGKKGEKKLDVHQTAQELKISGNRSFSIHLIFLSIHPLASASPFWGHGGHWSLSQLS